jgi:hypothetical protein
MSTIRSGWGHVAALLAYVGVAVVFFWPLPLQMQTSLPGPAGSDTGSYVWNLWLFRHEIVAHGSSPFFTSQILPLTPHVPLTLHNYTTAANIAAFPLLPTLGTVATFNLLMMVSCVLAAYAMFLLARRLAQDTAAAWVAGLAFGFSPFMMARTMEHFSLVQTAALPLFVLLLDRLRTAPSKKTAAALGAVVAWAFLSDPYYAIYCLLIAAIAIGAMSIVIRRAAHPRPRRWASVLDVTLICLAGLIAGILIHGGGRLELLGIRVSIRRLYTPVLIFTVLALLRIWLFFRPKISWVLPPLVLHVRAAAVAVAVCAAVLSPVLHAMTSHAGERQWINPKVLWRSSSPGHDLLAFFVPNPVNGWFGSYFHDGLARMPNGFVENVASIPWVLILVVAIAAAIARRSLPRYWLAFTAAFAILALGPFVHVAGVNTYVPTPWALLRYLPLIGAARMPTRFAVLVMLGASVLFAFALRELRARSRFPRLAVAGIAALLTIELLPAPRMLHSARVPAVYNIIAADPRPVRVLNLPFGLSDGLESVGRTTAAWQYYQTVHAKQILGGALSRLPHADVEYYQRRRVTNVLMALSAGRQVSPERLAETIRRAHEIRDELNIGYVVMNTDRVSSELSGFAHAAFDLTPVATDGPYHLFRTPLAPPIVVAVGPQ